jgi:hypothetical protein
MELANTVDTVGWGHSYKRPPLLSDKILAILFTAFGLRAPKGIYNIWRSNSFYIAGTCCMLFQKRVVRTTFDIYVFCYYCL